MCKFIILLVGVFLFVIVLIVVNVDDVVVGVSWFNFQEECWKMDEVVIKGVLEVVGVFYIFVDV